MIYDVAVAGIHAANALKVRAAKCEVVRKHRVGYFDLNGQSDSLIRGDLIDSFSR